MLKKFNKNYLIKYFNLALTSITFLNYNINKNFKLK